MKLISFLNFIDQFLQNMLFVFNVETIIQYGGLPIMFLAVYAQTGLFFCFFIPSGAVLFTGGMFVATGLLEHNIITVCICLVIASVLGCFTGYGFGRKAGPLLYQRKDSKFFKQQHLHAAESFYKKYGQLALTAGLLFPITRTFAPIVAGMVKMPVSRFGFLVFFGSVLWVPVFLLAGYLIGNIPGLREYLPYMMTAIIVLVTTPVVIRIVKEFKKAGKENKQGLS